MEITTRIASAHPLPQGKISYEEFLQWVVMATPADAAGAEGVGMVLMNLPPPSMPYPLHRYRLKSQLPCGRVAAQAVVVPLGRGK